MSREVFLEVVFGVFRLKALAATLPARYTLVAADRPDDI
jgi:hypothetical protein